MPWMTPEHAVIARDFDPSDLRPLLDACGIDRTILVQSACTDRDTDAMFAHAARARLDRRRHRLGRSALTGHERRPGSTCSRGSRRCEGFAI